MAEPQVSFAIIARNEAGKVLADVQLDLERVAKRATGTGGSFSELGGAASRAEPGVRKMENALQNLALRAAGIEGPIGKLIEGLAVFGVGGVAVGGFAAGFFTMTKAMEFFGQGAAEAEARLLSLRQEQEKLTRTPLMNASALRITAQTQRDDAAKHLERLQSGDFSLGEKLWFSGVEGQSKYIEALDRARLLMDESSRQMQTFTDSVEAIRATTDALDADLARMLGTGGGGQAGGMRDLLMGTRLLEGERGKPFDTRGASIGSKAAAKLGAASLAADTSPLGSTSDIAGTVKALSQLNGAIQILATVAGSGSTQIGTLAQGIGGILAGVKGVNPLVGIGLEIGGSLINALFGHRKSDPMPVNVTNADELARKLRTGPDKVSINVQLPGGSSFASVDVDLRRLARLDGISRVPYGVPAPA